MEKVMFIQVLNTQNLSLDRIFKCLKPLILLWLSFFYLFLPYLLLPLFLCVGEHLTDWMMFLRILLRQTYIVIFGFLSELIFKKGIGSEIQ